MQSIEQFTLSWAESTIKNVDEEGARELEGKIRDFREGKYISLEEALNYMGKGN